MWIVDGGLPFHIPQFAIRNPQLSMTRREDLYIILEIGRTASENDIKKAFRKLARRFHPDINPGDRSAEERFKRISEAYEILSDPLKRRFYDDNGFYTEGVLPADQGGDWGFSFEGFDFSKVASTGFTEAFGQAFARGRAAPRREPDRGQDLEYQISLSFDDSIRGIKTKISVLRKSPCAACKGNGRLSGSRDSVCNRCGGIGKTSVAKGLLQFSVTCPDCGGAGRHITECRDCGGEGRLPKNESVDVEIPAGVSTGSRIRFQSRGDAGRLGGPP